MLSTPLSLRSPMPADPKRDPLHDPLLRDVPVQEGHKVLDRRYVLYDVLGQGGMGTIYRGEHLILGQTVAIKCLDPSLARRDERFVARFHKEGRAAVRIDDRNVVRVIDVAESAGLHYLAMEFVEGENARERVERKRRLGVEEAVTIALGAARGLAAAHAAGLVHRDVKPENVLISTRGEVKLADLGLAKTIEGESGLTYSGATMGTPRYMPPEQFVDARHVGPPADVYALGATLYYLLAGRDGVTGSSLAEVMDCVRSEPFPRLRDARQEVPPELDDLVARCVAKNPAERPRNARELVRALERFAPPQGTTLADAAAGTTVARSVVSPPPARTIERISKSAAGTERDRTAEGKTVRVLVRALVLACVVVPLGLALRHGLSAPRAVGIELPGVARDGKLYFASTPAMLEGLLRDRRTDVVRLKGPGNPVAAVVDDTDRFTFSLDLPANAATEYELTAGQLSRQVTLVHDSIAPTVALLSPATDRAADASTKLVVRVDDTNVASASVNGERMSQNDEGLWVAEVALWPGTNTFQVRALDRAGNTGELALAIDRVAKSAEPVSIELDSPAVENGRAYTSSDYVELAGRVVNARRPAVAVAVDDGALVDHALGESGRFEKIRVPLPRLGEHRVTLASDGLSERLQLVVTRDPDPPRMTVAAEPSARAPEGWEIVDAAAPPGAKAQPAGPAREAGWAWRVRDPATGVAFLLVEPGTFWMGSPDGVGDSDEHPRHQVTIERAFYLAETEVTQEQWARGAALGAAGDADPSSFDGATRPVESVSWTESAAWCEKLGYRLPTEAEWEYACRAGTQTDYSTGDGEGALKRAGWYGEGSEGSTHPVRGKEPTPWGFYDMHGNVYEWMQDCWSASYEESRSAHPDAFEPANAGSRHRVFRGGCCFDEASRARSAYRYFWRPEYRSAGLGFRPVRSLP